MTLFTEFNKEVVARIWDIYMLEGRKTIFSFILAILKVNEAKLIAASEEVIMNILADYKDKIDINLLVRLVQTDLKIEDTDID